MRIQIGNRRNRRLEAATLAEILVCVLIINIGAAALMGCFKYAFFITGITQQNQRATQVMLERAEAIRLCSWDQVRSNGFIPKTFTEYYDPSATTGNQGVLYSGTVTIAPFPYSTTYSNNMRQLKMTLQWQSGKVSHARTNVTYIARDGIQNYVY
jgi:Tfp pilus assembly protein PilV